MKEVKKIIRKKGINIVILSIFLLLLDLVIFACLNEDSSVTGLLKGKCVVDSVSDVEKCKDENPYVKINFDAIYDTTYVYQLNEKTVAKYLDIDLDGKSLISLVDKNTAEKLLNNEQQYVEGKLIKFYDVHSDALNQIKSYYSSEGIQIEFISIQFSNYDLSDGYISIIILVVFTGFILFMFGKGIYMITKTENNYYYKIYKDDIDKLNRELNSEYRYKSKGIIITDNYIFNLTAFNFKIYNLSDIKWVYQKNVKRYGITINKTFVINFIDGKNIVIPFKKQDVLNHFSKDVLVGYTNENIKTYQNIVKEYKINHK